jgi:hypothetical protein
MTGVPTMSGVPTMTNTLLDHRACAWAEPRDAAGQDDFVHDVTWLEWLLGDVLRVKIPRARCGVLLLGDPDRPDPIDLGAPMCPRCAELGGYE